MGYATGRTRKLLLSGGIGGVEQAHFTSIIWLRPWLLDLYIIITTYNSQTHTLSGLLTVIGMNYR